MKRVSIPPLYQHYFTDKSDERRMLFSIIEERYHPRKGLYPGSFVHITPSFFIQDMTYIDADRRISKFFTDQNVQKYIDENKTYRENALVHWFQADYESELPIEEESFDVLFSLYAGFISQSCKKYLKENGILVCNNSHGDASIAYLDYEYIFAGVIKRQGEKFTIIDSKLDEYFIKKDGRPIDKKKVLNRMKGENFSRKGYAYIFRYCSKPVSSSLAGSNQVN